MEDKKKIETSKLLLVASYLFAGILSACAIAGTFMNLDISNLTIVAGAAWGEVAAASACYYNKAKTENRLKITQGMVQTLSRTKEFEPDVLVQILDSVVKEG